jgi:hypothetical protein
MKGFGWKAVASVLGCAGVWLAQAQAQSQQASVVGDWHLVRIESQGPDGKPSEAPQPTGLLIYTREGHASVQLMYPQTSLSNEFVHDGYEATFGSYEVDEGKHQLTYHIQGSATREKLVGKSETLVYDLPDERHMVIRPVQSDQHWSVTWERY